MRLLDYFVLRLDLPSMALLAGTMAIFEGVWINKNAGRNRSHVRRERSEATKKGGRSRPD